MPDIPLSDIITQLELYAEGFEQEAANAASGQPFGRDAYFRLRARTIRDLIPALKRDLGGDDADQL